MSVQTGRMVSADELRDEAIHQAENWLMAFGALIPADQIHNIAIKLAADLAKPAIETVAEQAEQIAAVLALHSSRYGGCRACTGRVFVPYPCDTARALGVSGE